jgi:hypothetical protein
MVEQILYPILVAILIGLLGWIAKQFIEVTRMARETAINLKHHVDECTRAKEKFSEDLKEKHEENKENFKSLDKKMDLVMNHLLVNAKANRR